MVALVIREPETITQKKPSYPVSDQGCLLSLIGEEKKKAVNIL